MHTRRPLDAVTSLIHRSLGLLLCGCLACALAACPRPPEPSEPNDEPSLDCPEPPESMSTVEALRLLSRTAREVRANLMVRHDVAGGALVATLHHPRLALMEAVLASPKDARARQRRWLRDNLLLAYVEIRAPRALAALDGNTDALKLRDGRGRRYPVLLLVRRDVEREIVYRLVFDPPPIGASLQRLELVLPGERGRPALRLRWGLSARNLEALDELPLIFQLARLRRLQQARRDALLGRAEDALLLARETEECAPDLASAAALHEVLRRPRPTLIERPLRLGASAGVDEPHHGAPTTAALTREVALRAQLLARLAPSAARGLLAATPYTRCQQLLRNAARATRGEGSVGAGYAALVRFDGAVADLLARALAPNAPLGAARPRLTRLRVAAAAAAPVPEVARELRLRVGRASLDLHPRWIAVAEATKRAHVAPDELVPLLRARHRWGTLLAKTRVRLGRGWLHGGLPRLSLKLSFADHSAEHWAARVRATHGAAELHRLAEALLLRELSSPDPRAAAVAAEGLVQLRGARASASLLPIDPDKGVRLAAARLRAIASLPGQQVTAAIHGFARARQAPLRAAAMTALARRGRADEVGLLLAGLQDPTPAVARAALRGLLRRGNGAAIRHARAALKDEKRREATASLLARLPTSRAVARGLRTTILAQLASAPSAALVAAAARHGGRGATKRLAAVFRQHPPLRGAVLQAARASRLAPLARLGLAATDAPLRRLAARALGAAAKPSRALMRRLTKDPDKLVRLIAHLTLARLGDATSLLALGAGGRGSCAARQIVLPYLSRSLDAKSRRHLLRDALRSRCDGLWSTAWGLVVRHQANDVKLLRRGMGHPARWLRAKAALTALGLRRGVVLPRGPRPAS